LSQQRTTCVEQRVRLRRFNSGRAHQFTPQFNPNPPTLCWATFFYDQPPV